MPRETFKSKEAYRKWTAYRHIHGIPAPHLKEVTINGKTHKVKHSALSRNKQKTDTRPAKHSDVHAFVAGRRS